MDAGSRDEAAAFVAFEHHVDHIVVFRVLDRLSKIVGEMGLKCGRESSVL